MSVTFEPDSWDRAAERVISDGEAFAAACEARMSGMTTAALNCDGFGTLMDAAFAVVFPPSIQAFQETAAGLGRGFSRLGDAMGAVGAPYRATEEEGTAIASEAGN